MARIFDPMFSTSREDAACGLPIVRTIVESHTGMITGSSSQGWSTTWMLCLSSFLLVRDDIRKLSVPGVALRYEGQTVETASNGIDAASNQR